MLVNSADMDADADADTDSGVDAMPVSRMVLEGVKEDILVDGFPVPINR